MIEIFIYGLIVGYFLNPFITVLKAIFMNAWNATSACTGDCNQGRNCNCKGKQNGV